MDRPLLFSTEMVRALLAGNKSQTRRTGDRFKDWKCGDKIWVKETHYLYGKWFKNGLTKTGKQKWTFKDINSYRTPYKVFYADNPPSPIRKNSYREEGYYKRPSIFMHKKKTRIWLELTADVRQERLQEITEEEAKAEGVLKSDWEFSCAPYRNYLNPDKPGYGFSTAKSSYASLWDKINGGKKGFTFSDNPEVTVLEFRKL